MSAAAALQADTGSGLTPAPEQETRLHGRQLLVARSVVFTVIGFTLGLYLLALPGLYPRLSVPARMRSNGVSSFPSRSRRWQGWVLLPPP